MRISDWSSDVCSSDLVASQNVFHAKTETAYTHLAGSVEKSLTESVTESARAAGTAIQPLVESTMADIARETSALHDTIKQAVQQQLDRSEEHTSELQSLMRISYAVFCLKKKKTKNKTTQTNYH